MLEPTINWEQQAQNIGQIGNLYIVEQVNATWHRCIHQSLQMIIHNKGLQSVFCLCLGEKWRQITRLTP